MTREPDIVERLRDIAGEWADAEIREEAADEIERLRRLVDEREADLGRMHGETSAREPDDYFTGACPTCGQAYLRAEIERLKAGMKEYACTATDHPCGCYDQFLSERAEIERLKAENAALPAKPCSRCGLWPEPKDPCADMACPAKP